MHARAAKTTEPSASLLTGAMRLGLLLVPLGLLFTASWRSTGLAASLLWLGTIFQALACGLAVITRQGWRQPVGSAVIMLYVIALSWLILGVPRSED